VSRSRCQRATESASSAAYSVRAIPVKRTRRRPAFSIIELLVALTISSMLLTATLVALNASFRSYKVTTESASSHVVGRLVMQRLLTLIRTGEEFGPYPANPIVNPIIKSTSIEFAVPVTDTLTQVWTIERVTAETPETGPYYIQATVTQIDDGTVISTETRIMLRYVQDMLFTLEYDVGPRLIRANIDLTLRPDDDQADSIAVGPDAPIIRMVASVSPRRLEE